MEYVLITGASSGIGKELAIRLSSSYAVILGGRNKERLKETAMKCKNKTVLWQYDLNELNGLEDSLINLVREDALTIRGFVHCAGKIKMAPIRSLKVDDFQSIYATNVLSAAMIVKTLAVKRVNGKNLRSVVFISSNISERGASSFSAYGSSKSALDGLMRNLSVEMAPICRVNSVLPGGMITEMTKHIYEDEMTKTEFEKNYPLGIGEPADVVPMVEFLLSEASKWITGQQFTVDGGRTIDITERKNNFRGGIA